MANKMPTQKELVNAKKMKEGAKPIYNTVDKKEAKAAAKNKQKGSTSSLAATLKRVAKIDRLPKNVRESIPLRGFMDNGIIETYPGTFTKSYMLDDVNFSIATEEEQGKIFRNFMDLLNSFSEKVKWQFCIYNHEEEKKSTIKDIRIQSQRDGLNKYRQEMNNILLQNLKRGNNSILQDKILVVSIEDSNAEHAVSVFKSLDRTINEKLKKITKTETNPMTTQERMKQLYSIYNQDFDYRFSTGMYEGKENFNIEFIEKCGLSVKDVIGPPSIDYSNNAYFMLGDTYAQALYLEKIPTWLSTDFIADLASVQSNMLISTNSEIINQEHAIQMVRSNLANIEARATAVSKRNLADGYIGSLPPDLERSMNNARSLMNDITNRNQNLFFITFTVVVFARTLEQLFENIKLVKSVASKHICPIKTMRFQQEFCFNTSLPLCRNDVFVERLYTTESASVFIPFNSQEIRQKNAIFYGLNQTSKNMIMYDRRTGANYNGLIFGMAGSGKSFIAKCEMISVLLSHSDAQVFVIDPQGEYYPLARAFRGQEINLWPGSNVYINPLDLDISADDEEVDPITMKSDFIISMFDVILGKGRSLSPVHSSIIDRCVRKIYRAYIDDLTRSGLSSDPTKCPTLSDLYQELLLTGRERPEARQLAEVIEQYSVGSFDTFAHRTNVETKARFIVYNIKRLGTGMKELGLHVCLNDIWNRMISNSKRRVYTWAYIDEFHLLLESDGTTLFLKRIWKMARKWLGVPTGIMQNTEDLLRNEDTRNVVNNTTFTLMLKAPLMDRNNLAELYRLSNAQLEYITDSDPGRGLLNNGKITLPFELNFPKNTELYKILTTAHDVEGAVFV